MLIVRRTKAGVVLLEDTLERVVQHGCPDVEERLHRRPVPVHLLSCPFSIGLHENFRPDFLFPVDGADAGMHGGGRALSDG